MYQRGCIWRETKNLDRANLLIGSDHGYFPIRGLVQSIHLQWIPKKLCHAYLYHVDNTYLRWLVKISIFLRVLLTHTCALREILSHKSNRDWRCRPSIAARAPYSFAWSDLPPSDCHQNHMYIGSNSIGNVYRWPAVMRVWVHHIASAKVCWSPLLSSSSGWVLFFPSMFHGLLNNPDRPPPPVVIHRPMRTMKAT